MEQLVVIAVERLVAIAIGGVSIYLGYQLFRSVKATGEGGAEVKLPGDVTVMVTRVGPGVFFALFGAVVVGASLAFPMKYTETARTDQGRAERTLAVTGIGEAPQLASVESTQQVRQMERLRVRQHIEFLNGLRGLLDRGLPEAQQERVKREVRDAKLRLMNSVWAEDWGSYEDFKLWAEGGSKPPDSRAFRSAREFFAYGPGATP